jgi:Kef-type K+ transport system membrane component KefB
VFTVMGLFEVGLLGAALVGAMWASNTLVAYPEVQAAGLQDNRAVSAAVSAGVVADLLSLMVLASATATAAIELGPFPDTFGEDFIDLVDNSGIEPSTPDPALPLWLALMVLILFCLWVLPRIAEWFFIRIGRSRTQRLVFLLAGMAAGATIASLGGIEGLIGAFLAGLGMNPRVPAQGPLMERVDFVGSAIFVPAFLVSIGLNIDPALLIDPDTLLLGVLFTGFVIVGKTIAALVTARIFKFSMSEVGLMSSLSFGQAASTLAIAQVGLSLGMFDQIVVNAAVLAIVMTALITSYGTRFFLRRVPRPIGPRAPLGAKILLDVRNRDSDLDTLITLAAGIAQPDDGLIVPYAITEPGKLEAAESAVERAAAAVSLQGLDCDGIARVDESFAVGTLRLVEEHRASLVMLAWDGPRLPSDYVTGADIDTVGGRAPVPSMAARVLRPWNRIVATLGDTSVDWRRVDAEIVLAAVDRLRRSRPVPVVIVAADSALAERWSEDEQAVEVVTEISARTAILERLEPTDLVLAPARVLRDLPAMARWQIVKALEDANVAILGGPHRLLLSRATSHQPLTTPVDSRS